MKKDGFTLIELLAVIVILAIIALIAVPIILDIIGDTKSEANKRSIDLYGKSIELAIARKNLIEEVPKGSYKTNGNTLTLEDSDFSLDIEYEGSKVECDTVRIYEDGTVSLNKCKVDGRDIEYAYGIYTDNSRANTPELVDGLTPVIYDETSKQWKIADTSKEWYDYDKKEWANAVILNDGVENKIGKELKLPISPDDTSSDIKAMFVWIPRYEYKMPTNVNKSNPDLIDINFISKSTNTPTDGYILHLGFTFGSDILSGIWVGKFETTGNEETPTILPNQISLRNQIVSAQFKTSQKFNTFLGDNGDSHMMKNSEWGAVAYLSHSKYGKDGEVYINNCSQYITGIGADSVNASKSTDTCTKEQNKYNGESGVNASTTGNIYGVYDMSGGAFEFVMSYLTTASNTWGSASDKDYAGFENKPDDKYFDAYSTTDLTIACNGHACNGHALIETQGWYGDIVAFFSKEIPWFKRGGCYSNSSGAGVFFISNGHGYSYDSNSFRVIIS